jgi:hypothetical protein
MTTRDRAMQPFGDFQERVDRLRAEMGLGHVHKWIVSPDDVYVCTDPECDAEYDPYAETSGEA